MNAHDAFECIRRGFRENRLAHGYILVGPPRGEAGELAVRVLQLLVCAAADGPCGECRPCRQAASHTYADVLWIEPEKKSRRISVEQVREFQKMVMQTSYVGGWKAVVIAGADRLGREAANAFLKTLEEPPARCLFLLLTDSPQFLLPTVISRCQTLSLTAVTASPDAPWVEKVTAILDELGGPRSAAAAFHCADEFVSMLKDLKKDAEKEETESASDDDEKDAVEARAEALYRERRTEVIRAMLLWYRDILLLACGGERRLLMFPAHAESLRRQADSGGVPRALERLRVIEDINRQVERSLPEGMVLGTAFQRLGG